MEADFPKLEEQILKRWKQEQAFETSIKRRKGAPRFVFYEGPPTANGRPGIHHVLSRAFKDAVCRYKTMRGFYVERKAGWDTHGLPVELEVEKKLGLKSKKEIEEYGVGRFNKECMKSVWQYKKEWEDLTERIAFWLDQEHPYITYQAGYMESLWWIIKQFSEKGLLYKGHKVVPYCPRCGTAVSSHEVAQGYKTVKDQSVYVKFKIKNQNRYLLAWTTTPWTLPGNVALAVGKNIKYAIVRQGNEEYILARNLIGKLRGEYTIVEEVLGSTLVGLEYEPLFDSLESRQEKKHYVVAADFVSTEDGTGIVHTAVMYGEDDYQLGQQVGLPKVHTVDEEGKFNELVPQWQGLFVKDAEPLIIEDLRKRHLLYQEELYEHEYPFCWRCSTHLLYYAKDSWFVNMQKGKKQLIRNNQSINWIPSHIKTGRMGEWLAEVKDWAFSRERYWGTPLPVWECSLCEHREVAGSIEDLGRQKYSENTYYILRHGHSERQTAKIASSWPEKKPLPLTSKGKKQIQQQAKKLLGKKIDLIISSDLLRAKETAEIVGRELNKKPIIDKRLREYLVGTFNGKPIAEFIGFFREEGESRLEHYMKRFYKRPPKGETWEDVQKRLYRLIADVEKKYKGKTILFVSHELPLTLFEGLLRGYTREETVKFRMKKAIETGELRKLAVKMFPYNDHMELDLHRPYIDDLEFICVQCKKGRMRRVKDVVDVWFDSGSMPFAQQHYPFENKKAIDQKEQFPADYIVEAIDQTRGWFYTLLAVSTLLGHKAPYENVISLGHVLDEKGEKMSKSKGNVVNPWDMINKYGVDTLRWYFYTLNHPWDPKLFAGRDVQQALRKFMLTLWNSFVFYQTYAGKSSASSGAQNSKLPNLLDKWVLSRLHSTIKEVTKRLDSYDITGAARAIESFVIDDLSLWYIRRSRARFQNPASKKELQEARDVLAYVLVETSKLSAPFIPFMSEHIYGEMSGRESVHWQDWPKAEQKRIRVKVEGEMARARDLVTRGLAERAKAGIKVRQPLASLKCSMFNVRFSDELLTIVKDELNVKEVLFDKNLKQEIRLDTVLTPALRREGVFREILRHIQEMRKKAGYRPGERVRLRYKGSDYLQQILRDDEKTVMSVVNVKEMKKADKAKQVFDAEQEVSIDGQKLWLGIQKL